MRFSGKGRRYHDLVLVIIDEQHRFNVHQRLMLTAKGSAGYAGHDGYTYSAYPRPHRLPLAIWTMSKLTEKPAGRQPITTAIVPMERMGEPVERPKSCGRRTENLLDLPAR